MDVYEPPEGDGKKSFLSKQVSTGSPLRVEWLSSMDD